MEARPKHSRPRRLALPACLLACAAACGTAPATTPTSPPADQPTITATATATETVTPEKELPAPDEKIPTTAAKLAAALEETTEELNASIDAWSKDGEPPEDLELLALHQQRIYRYAARHPPLATKAFARLPKALAAQARDNTEAIRGLLALAHPIDPDAVFKTQPARPAGELLGYFKKAERKFGVEWEVLAAVMFSETKFGRVKADSHVGAQGPMQFMPATWKAYGMGGDVRDPRDAVMGAANYLKASGAPRDYRRALHAYNPSQAYVNAILLHAGQIKRDPRAYYAYYTWQVYVITTAGERRLTGP
ncbi:hypothetical protein GCM10009850_033190 [Nonomuraea monospora]|uniref:Transglycosylase SLT domain-containing protein n=1 Tax=Nonomuraea monospora TaxID=568818 RepID=A0ABN3CEP8_9ACTN